MDKASSEELFKNCSRMFLYNYIYFSEASELKADCLRKQARLMAEGLYMYQMMMMMMVDDGYNGW